MFSAYRGNRFFLRPSTSKIEHNMEEKKNDSIFLSKSSVNEASLPQTGGKFPNPFIRVLPCRAKLRMAGGFLRRYSSMGMAFVCRNVKKLNFGKRNLLKMFAAQKTFVSLQRSQIVVVPTSQGKRSICSIGSWAFFVRTSRFRRLPIRKIKSFLFGVALPSVNSVYGSRFLFAYHHQI